MKVKSEKHLLFIFLVGVLVLSNGCKHLPPPPSCTVTVDLTSLVLIFNDHVGDDWTFFAAVNGTTTKIEYPAASSIRLYQARFSNTITLSILATAKESDNSPDVGSQSTTITMQCGSGMHEEVRELGIIVKEDKGRYAGNEAKWLSKILVTSTSHN